jgi:Uma2 family endonuclease
MLSMSATLEYPQKHPISAEEYLRMGEAGVFAPEARLELIDGEILEMSPIHPPHAGCVKALNSLLSARAGRKAILAIQDPMIISGRSVPQPDVMLLNPRPDFYRSSHPGVADVMLAVEVADTTLVFDLQVKVPLYARCGIREVWVVDVSEQVIHVFRVPRPDGYTIRFTVRAAESVECQALPEVRVTAEELFPG